MDYSKPCPRLFLCFSLGVLKVCVGMLLEKLFTRVCLLIARVALSRTMLVFIVVILIVACLLMSPSWSSPAYHKVWVGGAIVLSLYAEEPKVGEEVEIDVYIEALNPVDVTYFELRVLCGEEVLYEETIWRGQHLSGGAEYSDTIAVVPMDQGNLWLEVNAKYSDEYWIYTAYITLWLGMIRDKTYLELLDEYYELKHNYTILKLDYESLKFDYSSLQSDYESLRSDYEYLKSDYESIKQEYERLKSEYEWLYGAYLNLKTKHAILESDYEGLKSDYEDLERQFSRVCSERDFLNAVSTGQVAILLILIFYFIKKRKSTKIREKDRHAMGKSILKDASH